MDLQVELKPHVGREVVLDPDSRQPLLDGNGQKITVEVNHKQCLVFAGGKQVAIYCGEANQPNRFLSFIAPYPEPFQLAIAEKVTALVGGPPSKVSAVPAEEHDVPAEPQP